MILSIHLSLGMFDFEENNLLAEGRDLGVRERNPLDNMTCTMIRTRQVPCGHLFS
jgi:hypothetical protein